MSDDEVRRDLREDPDSLLSPTSDPGGGAFGTLGAEAGSDLNWFKMVRHRVQSRAATSSKYPWWVLWSLLAGLLALNFTFTVFIVDLPDVAKEFHTTQGVLTWTMVGPLLANGLAAPIFGKAGDILGHRRLYLFGLAGAAVSAILTALAPNVVLLLGARTLDGIQAAATGTASGALINLVFKPEERVKAMGWWSLIGAGGPVIGVTIGSPIIAVWGWRALFWAQLILIAIAMVVVSTVLPKWRGTPAEEAAAKAKARKDFREMDWIGSWTLSFSVTALMLGLSFGGRLGWTSPLCMVSWIVTVLGIVAFILRIRTAERPLIPPHYFTKRNFVWPMVVRASANFAYFGGFFLFPILMERGFAYSVGEVGAISIARPLTFSICSPIAGYVAVRIGEKTSAIFGMFFLTASMAMFALLHPSTGAWWVIIALSFSGLGMGVAMPSSSAIMSHAVRPNEFGVMSAAQMLAMQVGEVAGIQVMETLQSTIARRRGLEDAVAGAPGLLATFHWPFVLGGVVGLFGVVGAFFYKQFERTPRP